MLFSKVLCLTALALTMTSCAGAGDLVGSPPSVNPAPVTTAPFSPAPSKLGNPEISTNPLDDPNANSRITYSANFLSDPLPASVPPITVSKEDAEAIAARDQNFGDGVQPGSPTIALRLVTLGDPDQPRQPNVAWVLTWKDSEAIVRGGVNRSEAQLKEMRANTECVFVVVINAVSGVTEEIRQSCRAK